MFYSRPWSAGSPGCLILLLDQSGSMSDPFGLAQAGSGRRKCDMVATVLNGFLNELIVTNTVAQKDGSPTVRPRADVAVLGYHGSVVGSILGGPLENRDFVTLPELQMYPLDIERRTRKEVDETGRIFEMPMHFPIWVKPVADGGTPMCGALGIARNLAEQWAAGHPNSYPPVVINVSDGMATDGDPLSASYDISDISTHDGHALLFNVHITEINSAPVAYPASEAELPGDKFARQLFMMSSVIPESSSVQLRSLTNRPIAPGARGLIFNGDAASVRQMFVFASVPATKQLEQYELDPDR